MTNFKKITSTVFSPFVNLIVNIKKPDYREQLYFSIIHGITIFTVISIWIPHYYRVRGQNEITLSFYIKPFIISFLFFIIIFYRNIRRSHGINIFTTK